MNFEETKAFLIDLEAICRKHKVIIRGGEGVDLCHMSEKESGPDFFYSCSNCCGVVECIEWYNSPNIVDSDDGDGYYTVTSKKGEC